MTSISNTNTTIKIANGDDLRRFTAANDGDGPLENMTSFRESVLKLFHDVPSVATASLHWRDDDGDLITLATDADLFEARAATPAGKPLKLQLANTGAVPAAPAKAAEVTPEELVQEDDKMNEDTPEENNDD